MKFTVFLYIPGQDDKEIHRGLGKDEIEKLCEQHDVIPIKVKSAPTGNAWKVKTTIDEEIKFFSEHPGLAKNIYLQKASNSGECIATSNS